MKRKIIVTSMYLACSNYAAIIAGQEFERNHMVTLVYMLLISIFSFAASWEIFKND
jgi:hypothetical protein